MRKILVLLLAFVLIGCGAEGGESTQPTQPASAPSTSSTAVVATTAPPTTTAAPTTTIPKAQAIEEMDAEVARSCEEAADGLDDPEIHYDEAWSAYRTRTALVTQAKECVKARWAAIEEAQRKAEEKAREDERRAEEQRQAEEEAALGTVSQQNARAKAAQYLDYSAFSRVGLIKQLVYEGFSEGDAAFGIDGLNVDWNDQAAKKAAQYLDYSSFSRSGLIDQLLYEGFTQSQAEYGVSTTGL